MKNESSPAPTDQACLRQSEDGADQLEAAFAFLRGVLSEDGGSPWATSTADQESRLLEWASHVGLLTTKRFGRRQNLEMREAPWTARSLLPLWDTQLAAGTALSHRSKDHFINNRHLGSKLHAVQGASHATILGAADLILTT